LKAIFASTPTRALLPALAVLILTVALPAHAGSTYPVKCNTGGDAFGWSIASGADWDGDGFNDFAVSVPCVNSKRAPRSGKVIVYSGRNGKILWKKKGTQEKEWMGVGLAFINDINGDGRAELAIGAPGYDRRLKAGEPGAPGVVANVGRVKILRFKKPRVLRVVKGSIKDGGFGVRVANVGDVNSDGTPDFAVGAVNDVVSAGGRKGKVYVFSGKKPATVIDTFEGSTAAAEFGASIAGGLDMTGDAVPDILAGSGQIDANGANKSGQINGFLSPPPATRFVVVNGAKNDELGTGLAITDDHSGDGLADFLVGSPGADDLGLKRHGTATLLSSTGDVLFNIADPTPEEGGEFGSTVADVGDLNGDGVRDFAVGAIRSDAVKASTGMLRKDAGRVHAVSGSDGSILWSLNGNATNGLFGFSLGGDIDWNRDGTPDVLVGAIGAAPLGRRGAGSVRIFSGRDGHPLRSFLGRRGLETRIYVAGRAAGSGNVIRAFDAGGTQVGLNAPVLGSAGSAGFSAAVVDDRQPGSTSIPAPGEVKVAVGGGSRTNVSDVVVLDAGFPDKVLDRFTAFPDIAGVGANVAAGRFSFDEPAKIVAAQASSADGGVLVRIFSKLADSPSWFAIDQFQAFAPGERSAGGMLIDAGGATVAFGNVTGDKTPEIIVGTESGLPLVRVFDLAGNRLAEWFAYDPFNFAGVSVAAVDLDGNGGQREVVTVPRSGEAVVKAFRGDGTSFVPAGATGALGFSAYPAAVTGGATVAAADVDMDGKPEILTMPLANAPATVNAFELDGSPVIGFQPFNPLGASGGALAATDTFVRR